MTPQNVVNRALLLNFLESWTSAYVICRYSVFRRVVQYEVSVWAEKVCYAILDLRNIMSIYPYDLMILILRPRIVEVTLKLVILLSYFFNIINVHVSLIVTLSLENYLSDHHETLYTYSLMYVLELLEVTTKESHMIIYAVYSRSQTIC